jgi:hypothetical protein
MKTSLLSFLLLTLLAPQSRTPCMRIMPTVEIVSHSILIARVKVLNVEESDFGVYSQIAEVELVDVIDGDFTLGRVAIGAGSGVACADDWYAKKEEWLVFLERDGGLYHTINYQYGQFRIENDIVRAWRDVEGTASHKPYYSVREEVEAMIAGIRTPPPEPAPAEAPAPAPPPAAAPPTSAAPVRGGPPRKVAVPVRKERVQPQR